MAYLTTSDIESFLNITLEPDGVTLVQAIIDALSEYVDDYCGRTWTYGADTEITEVFDADSSIIKPEAVPVASIVSVTDNGNEIDSEVIYNYGNYIRIDTGLSGKYRAITLVYKTAATTIPKPLKHALVQWAAQIFKSQADAGKEVTRVNSGPVSVDYARSNAGVPEFVQLIMKKYRLVV
jgi:hypothetical protein